MVGALVNMLIAQVVKKTGLSGADRIFGVAFGTLRGGLIIIVFVVIGGMTPLPEADWWQIGRASWRERGEGRVVAGTSNEREDEQ